MESDGEEEVPSVQRIPFVISEAAGIRLNLGKEYSTVCTAYI